MSEIKVPSDPELLELLDELERRRRYRVLETLYPERGPLRRELYAKHMEFFKAGKFYRERCMLAANRVGKSYGAGGFETAVHATGLYPSWWEGRKFNHHINIWCAGSSSKTTRDVIQKILLGEATAHGTGLIPKECIVRTTSKPGIADGIEDIYVKHVSGGITHIGLKSYEQGAESFVGDAVHLIWLDEEPPSDIYSECLTRTMIVDAEGLHQKTTGMVICTFTPLNGMSDVVMTFLPGGQLPGMGFDKFVVQVTWDEVPHLTKEMKESLWSAYPPHEREARSKGRPQLGSGAIYPFAEEDLTCAPFEIPQFWPRAFGLDVGGKTAAVWIAWDRQTDTVYVYSEYYKEQDIIPMHARAIKSRGAWIPGVIDPHSQAGSPRDGQMMIEDYRDEGLNVIPALNKVEGLEGGLERVRTRFATSRLKIFITCKLILEELRLYRRDKHGKVVKMKDHLLDALRYAIMSGLEIAITEPRYEPDENDNNEWKVGRNPVTGY